MWLPGSLLSSHPKSKAQSSVTSNVHQFQRCFSGLQKTESSVIVKQCVNFITCSTLYSQMYRKRLFLEATYNYRLFVCRMQQKYKGLLLESTKVFETYEVSMLTVLTCSYKPVTLKLITKNSIYFIKSWRQPENIFPRTQ